jgi:hypothetical protein
MGDSRLPENLNQWPHDPFELLGVNHASSRRDVKRAYAQLIRVYKPEHFPDQFRRIRDAYELLDQRLAWMESAGLAEEVVTPIPADRSDSTPGRDTPDNNTPGSGAMGDGPRDAAPEDATGHEEPAEAAPREPSSAASSPRDDLWQKARHGDLAEAYQHYSQLARSGRADDEVFVRLFWMLRLTQEIDPVRDAREWLVAGMQQFGLRGRLPELYRCELLDDPGEALSGRCDAVLRCAGHLGLLTELLIARWQGAARLQQWEKIAEDLGSLRGRLQDESAVWGRLLLAAIDHLAWAPRGRHHETFLACLEEIEQVAEHSLPIAAELNQRDNLRDLVEACEQLKSMTNLPLEWRKSLRALLVISWNQPLDYFRHRLLEVLAPLAQNPIVGLEWLDRLAARCGPALHRLGTLIVMLASQSGLGREAPPPEVLRIRLIEFLLAVSKSRYPDRWMRWMKAARQRDRSGRLELLMFCLDESLTMQQMTNLLASGLRQDLAQFLAPAGSAPLHFICLAYQAFWA